MLSHIRKNSNNLFFRALFVLVLIAFAYGLKQSYRADQEDAAIVQFRNAQTIKRSDFLEEKYRFVQNVQKNLDNNISYEELGNIQNNPAVNLEILNDMIYRRLLDNLVQDYCLDLSSADVMELIKNNLIESNQNNYDLDKQRQLILSIGEVIKAEELRKLLISSLQDTTILPNSLISHLSLFNKQIKVFDLVVMKLDEKFDQSTTQQPTEEELKEFYQNNIYQFEIPEKRSFSYIYIPFASIEKNIATVNDEEVQAFTQENSEDVESLEPQKIQEMAQNNKNKSELQNLIRAVENDIASGLDLKDLSSKYNWAACEALALAYNDLLNAEQKDELKQGANHIFDLEIGEVSYPIELNSGLLIVHMHEIKNQYTQNFEEVRVQVTKGWREERNKENNYKLMQQLNKDFDATKISSLDGAYAKLKIYRGLLSNNFATRVTNIEFNDNFYEALASTPNNGVTLVADNEDYAYFAYVRETRTSKKPETPEERAEIKDEIKSLLLEEIINYEYKTQEVDIKQKDLK
ncbi:Peptidyl-prolyl cis-trans isomerase [Rickettsiales endosymbiont of Paramecium tredecaurelia]|uniref:peptidyl-prolyl cis-trans isomerase n=1 Tax=Candidatus Sarmatiella mevalonica TaxID=2770581 RepID=UPI00192404F7|nr:peptidyl-prolyl cis-trans isomerase [Candidatus Sarmatiella mevalonica]MBL3284306.1 Peptidyl-prolyl cis-trans isomerase [Candidatus Sarmatiella mevalonica]